jgi:flagellar hook assembly protein FlgD
LELPTELALGRNHPNPFNPQTIIPYTVPKGAPIHVRIVVFDATGRRVRTLVDETQSAGAREVFWRGENEAGTVVASGIYYCVMEAQGKRFTQKLVLLK